MQTVIDANYQRHLPNGLGVEAVNRSKQSAQSSFDKTLLMLENNLFSSCTLQSVSTKTTTLEALHTLLTIDHTNKDSAIEPSKTASKSALATHNSGTTNHENSSRTDSLTLSTTQFHNSSQYVGDSLRVSLTPRLNTATSTKLGVENSDGPNQRLSAFNSEVITDATVNLKSLSMTSLAEFMKSIQVSDSVESSLISEANLIAIPTSESEQSELPFSCSVDHHGNVFLALPKEWLDDSMMKRLREFIESRFSYKGEQPAHIHINGVKQSIIVQGSR